MTQDELDALPEVQGVAIYQPEDEPMAVVGADGERWLLGRHEGRRVKVRGRVLGFGIRVDEQGLRVPYVEP